MISMVQSPAITVVGDCCLDLMMYGLPETLPVERELLAERMAMRIGGSGTITAHNLSCLGNPVAFVYASGSDSFGQHCRERLDAAKVDLSGAITRPGAATGVTVLLQHEVRRHMFTYPGVTNSLTPADIDLDFVCRAQHFHMASFYLQRGLTLDIPELLRRIKTRGLTVSMDPNDDPDDTWDRVILDALQHVDVFMPNEREACRATGEDDLEKAIASLRRRVPLLVIKRGAKGATAYTNADTWHVPARLACVVDAIGAGDSFNAGFLHGYVRRWPIEECLQFGALTGAWSTTVSGGTDAFFDGESREKMWQAWAARESTVTR
jgi:sugar/nucleoside kinase (ribokinase family)